jgi:hypothetical protein
MDQVGLPILIPERTGVYPSFGWPQEVRLAPGSQGIGGFGHIDSEIRIPVIYVILPFMIPDGRGPGSVSMLRTAKHRIRDLPFKHVIHDPPVNHVPGMQHRNSGYTVKAG